MKTLESRDFGGLVITEPLSLKKTKLNKELFFDLCGQLERCGVLKERYINTIALCSNALYDYYYYLDLIRRKNATTDEETIDKYYKKMYAAERRYGTYIPLLGLSPKSTLSLKLNDDADSGGVEEYEKIID